MERSRTDLAHAIDALANAGRATVTESRTELALYQLGAADAREIVALLEPAGFRLTRLADDGGDIPPGAINDASVGIELVSAKPVVSDAIFPVLTTVGFARVLDRAPAEAVLWVQGLRAAVETITAAYLPWGTESAFTLGEEPPDPARVVRFLGDGEPPGRIGRWLLRDPDVDVSGPILTQWRRRACLMLCRALAQEVERDGRLLFRGPPPTRFRAEGDRHVDVGSLAALQRAVEWVFQNPRELENRHGLLAAEVARTALRDGDLTDLASIMGGALEGAKIAYGFGVSQQSRDALKTLSDLRKAVADETQKLSDTTRSLASAVMTSTVGNVGLIVARLTLGKGSTFIAPAAALIGIALAAYVGIVIASGWQFLAIQRDLRSDWRERLYRFLGEAEYEKLVSDPVGRAEKGFRNTSFGAAIVSVLLLVATLLVVLG